MKTISKHEKFTPDNRIKILELFGGIGAPRKALENLGIDTKHVDYVEVLNWAVLAYNKMYNNDYKQSSVSDWNLDIDIVIHGSPCQDFSQAGKGLGGEEGLDTRSSLMWETVDIIENRLNKLPKVVIWENVGAVLNKNHKPTFDKYLKALEELGYENKYEVLNSKDFGIPQSRNRVFVVSVLKKQGVKRVEWLNYDFDFNNINRTETDLRLKDFLEEHPKEEWYYVKQKSMLKAIEDGKIKIVDNVVQTITTKQWRWNNAGVIMVPLTTFNQENYVRLPEEAFASTLTAGGANSRQKIAVPLDKVGEVFIEENNIPVFDFEGEKYVLRILTERECWRLMGFTDQDINVVMENKPPIPRTGLYHLAGNSIVVQVLEAIFKELING